MAAATFALKWRTSITLLVAECGEFCFFCIDVCVECFQSSLSLFSCIIERQGLGKQLGVGEGRGGEGSKWDEK
jgi:hypothetical protein